MHGFKKIIKNIKPSSVVLDVGGWGCLGGVNSSKYLMDKFKNVYFLNKDQREDKVNIIEDWFSYNPDSKFDVIVIDINWRMTWTDKEFEKVSGLLNDEGIFITYLNLESAIKNPDVIFQKVDYKKWFEFLDIYPECSKDENRKGIFWVSFKKI
jgi:hypothetical protein